jgi:hypothetical protein
MPACSLISKAENGPHRRRRRGMRDTLNAILRREYRVLRAATGEAALPS